MQIRFQQASDQGSDQSRKGAGRSAMQWAGLVAGPTLALTAYFLLPESYADSRGGDVAFTHAGRATAAMAFWMAVWWMTEAIPVYATALLPLAVLPTVQATSITDAASPYGHELIFLFMGAFILALAIERWGLHTRVALMTLRWIGSQPQYIVGGFMGITAVVSMWVSNTATTVMMLPIALSVIGLLGQAARPARHGTRVLPEEEDRNFAVCLLLGVAYAASIGGVGTLIGTPPNLFLASYIKSQLGREVTFVRWMGIGLPLVAIFLPIAWLLLTRGVYPIGTGRLEGGRERIRAALGDLGPMKRGEWAVLIVFLLTAIGWITRPGLIALEWGAVRPFAGLSDPGIAMIAAVAVFLIPLDVKKGVFVMDWETAVKLPWGVLVLFGGGLSLAAAIDANGVGEFLGNQVSGLGGLPSVAIVLGVSALVIFLTELASNTATAAALIPILSGLAPGLGLHPYLLIIPAAIAASCAFMLPVATPPNAIVFGSGQITIAQMSKAGLWLNLMGIVLITALTYAVAIPLLGADPSPGG